MPVFLLLAVLLLNGCVQCKTEAVITFPETDGELVNLSEQNLPVQDKNFRRNNVPQIISHEDMDECWQGIVKVMFCDLDKKR